MNRLLLASACLAGLWFSTGTAHAQYGYGGYRPSSRTKLSPYLNLTRGGDLASNYFLGVLPEQERRYNDSLFSGKIRQLEIQQQQQRGNFDVARPTDEAIPPVPIAGQPIGSRTSASYFRQDPLSNHSTHRSPRLR